jgi:MFS family permease
MDALAPVPSRKSLLFQLLTRGMPMKPDDPSIGEWRQHWIVVFVSMIGLGIGTSHVFYMGIFIAPLEHEFGWTRAEISSGLLMNSIVGIAFSPFVGWVIDRLGTRRVGIPGMAIYCTAIALLSCAGPVVGTWWGLWFLVASGAVLIKPTVWALTVSQRFDRSRALALAIVLSGSGLGATFMPSLVTSLVSNIGWRSTFVAIGAGAALLSLPLLVLFLRDKIRGVSMEVRAATRSKLTGLSIKEGILSTRFLRVALCTILMTMVTAGMGVHFVPFLAQNGFSKTTAASLAGLIGLFSVVGRLVTGFLLDRWNGALVGGLSFSIPIIAAALWLNYDGGMLSAIIAASLLGLSLGAETDILAYLSTRYFGLQNYGTIYGTVVGLLAFGVGAGPTLAGFVYDKTHSYDLFVWAAIPACLASTFMLTSLGPYPNFAAVAEHRVGSKTAHAEQTQ